ncbi:hypothetical protein F4859DRAFT_492435 [Xylaria cf. heliscus]|nr:hypothetical protein F4859DRAFT_492435 [Xylaria cf. heliscus]
MFGIKTSATLDAGPSERKQSSEGQEAESLLSGVVKLSDEQFSRSRQCTSGATPWKVATAVLSLLLIIVVSAEINRAAFSHATSFSYETGFTTDLEPALASIKIRQRSFAGAIIVNGTSQFELILDPSNPRYVGKPTQELDDAWDAIVGNYIPLTESEAHRLQGKVDPERGQYYVVPHVRHSLHCLNYLRKVAYDKYYPTIRTENKPTVPSFSTHVDHCIEILRETIQCQGDLTPVPHIWSPEKQMYIADTSLPHTCRDFEAMTKWQDERIAAWNSGKASG